MYTSILSAAKTHDTLVCIGPTRWDPDSPVAPLSALVDFTYSQHYDASTCSPVVRLSRFVAGTTTLENEYKLRMDENSHVGLLFIARNPDGIVRAVYYEKCKQFYYGLAAKMDDIAVREDITFTCEPARILTRENAPNLDWDTPVPTFDVASGPHYDIHTAQPPITLSALNTPCSNIAVTGYADLQTSGSVTIDPSILDRLAKLEYGQLHEDSAPNTAPKRQRAVLTPRERVAAEREAKR